MECELCFNADYTDTCRHCGRKVCDNCMDSNMCVDCANNESAWTPVFDD